MKLAESTKGAGRFPSTKWSVLMQGREAALGSPTYQQAVDKLAAVYWRPVYAYIRLRWTRTPEEAMDLTQEFFLGMLEGRWLPRAAPERGRFRSFLMKCIDNLVKNTIRRDLAAKRGGGNILSIDFGEDAEHFLLAREGDSPEEILERHWRKAVLHESLRRLEEEYGEAGRGVYFEVFRRYELASDEASRPTYENLAAEFGITRADVDNYLSHARRRIRELVREALRVSAGNPADLAREEREFYRKRPW